MSVFTVTTVTSLLIQLTFCLLGIGQCTIYDRHGRGLSVIPDDIPANATTVRLHNNKIEYIEKGAFSNLNDCKRIDLADNSIFLIDEGALAGIKLDSLFLHENHLETLSWNIFFPGEYPKSNAPLHLYISNNPLNCDTNMCWLKHAQSERSIILEDVDICYSGLKWEDVPTNCPDNCDVSKNQTTCSEDCAEADSAGILFPIESCPIGTTSCMCQQYDREKCSRADVSEEACSSQCAASGKEGSLAQIPECIAGTMQCSCLDNCQSIDQRSCETMCQGDDELADLQPVANCPADVMECKCIPNIKYNYSTSSLTEVPKIPENSTQIDLANNQIDTVAKDSFSANTECREINLQGNNITKIEDEAFTNMQHLKQLDLESNKLAEIGSKTLKGLVSLMELQVAANKIKTIQNGAFDDLIQLKKLYLQNNLLHMIKRDMLRGLISLKQLDLSHNQIGMIESNSFVSPELTHFNVRNNNVKNLPWDVFPTNQPSTVQPLRFDISDNPLNCDANLCWVKEGEKDGSIILSRQPQCSNHPDIPWQKTSVPCLGNCITVDQSACTRECAAIGSGKQFPVLTCQRGIMDCMCIQGTEGGGLGEYIWIVMAVIACILFIVVTYALLKCYKWKKAAQDKRRFQQQEVNLLQPTKKPAPNQRPYKIADSDWKGSIQDRAPAPLPRPSEQGYEYEEPYAGKPRYPGPKSNNPYLHLLNGEDAREGENSRRDSVYAEIDESQIRSSDGDADKTKENVGVYLEPQPRNIETDEGYEVPISRVSKEDENGYILPRN